MNQLFNPTRFRNYAVCNLRLRYKFYGLLLALITFVVYIGACLVMLGSRHVRKDEWLALFLFIVIPSAILYSGSSFPDFRSKEKTIAFLQIPASTLEKYLFEFIMRIVVFLMLFPLVFFVSKSLAIGSMRLFVDDLVIEQMRDLIYAQELWVAIPFIISIFIFFQSVAFAGSTAFKKLPVVKTVVFVGVLIAITMSYIFILAEVIRIEIPYIISIFSHQDEYSIFRIGTAIIAVATLFPLSYAYFKLKEKEV